MRELNPSVEFANKTGLAYSAVCKPLCQKLHLPQTAFDILMFLANNPNYTTARISAVVYATSRRTLSR